MTGKDFWKFNFGHALVIVVWLVTVGIYANRVTTDERRIDQLEAKFEASTKDDTIIKVDVAIIKERVEWLVKALKAQPVSNIVSNQRQ